MPNDLQKQIDELKKDLQDLVDEVYRNNFSSSQDFPKYSRFNSRLRLPVVTTLSTTCEIGEKCVVRSTGKEYVCSAADTWTVTGSQTV